MLSSFQTLALLSLKGFGRRAVQGVLSESYAAGGELPLEELMKAARTRFPRIPICKAEDFDFAYEEASKLQGECKRLDVRTVVPHESLFPQRLRNIPDPPVILFLKGAIEALQNPFAVAVVGTREPTPWGKRLAERFGAKFAECGATVISGLAVGCDAAAHIGCLNSKGKTIAVLAHGLQMVYPAAHKGLAQQIVDSGGCLLSEYPPGVRGHPNYFVERDRIQSGLSAGVVVVETDLKGGTMHTVKACEAQHRVLACLAHPQKLWKESKTQGNQMLIRENRAMPISTESDLKAYIKRLHEHLSVETTLRTNPCDDMSPQMHLFSED